MTTGMLSAGWMVDERWTLRFATGLLFDGELDPEAGATHDVASGAVVAFGAEVRMTEGRDWRPFLDGTMTFGSTWATVTDPDDIDHDYSASDLRLGLRAGWLVGDAFPYLVGRIFGGPARWSLDGDDVTGSDVDKHQLALGAALPLGPVGLFGEWSFVGERGASGGLSVTW